MQEKKYDFTSNYFEDDFVKKAKSNFGKVKKYIDYEFNLPEFDSLVFEISKCLMIESFQAALTLTNHLLEKTLKYGLIYNTIERKQEEDFSVLTSKFEKLINQYGGLKLEDTINRCHSSKLITKEEKKELKIFKRKLRNPYSHADINETFENISSPITLVNFKTGKHENKNVAVPNFIFLHGIAQAMLAEEIAPKYFDYVYNILFRIINKAFPKE